MELIQAKGNTWFLADRQLIPVYKVNDDQCILIDSGLISQRMEIERKLFENGLVPVGIIGTHVHTDHSPNHSYFQEKYHIPVALSLGEAGIGANRLNIKSYYYMLSPKQVDLYEDYRLLRVAADHIIYPDDTMIHFCGVPFQIIHTAGHSPDHISVITPDGVLCIGDAILTGDSIRNAKLPYFFSVADGINAMKELKKTDCPVYLAAHRGVYSDINSIADENIKILKEKADQVCSLVSEPMTFSQIQQSVCREFRLLSDNPRKAAYYERNIRTYIDFLKDSGRLTPSVRDGVVFYEQS